VETEIKQALSRSVCGGWDRSFLESILEQIARGRKLSEKQVTTVSKVLLRNGESAQAIHDEWESVYYTEYATEAMWLADYYSHTGYFRELSRDILAGEVPDMRAYTKMSSNKYAQKIIETHNTEEDTTRLPWPMVNDTLSKFNARGGFIMEVTDIVRSAAKGAKTYKILPIGATNPIFVEERYIKIKRT
jgi:hypothetical protein